MFADCDCPDPSLCKTLKRHITGRLWEIWKGVNIEPAKAEAYRQLWRRQAAAGSAAAVEFRPRCRHRGEAALEVVSCPNCRKDAHGRAQVRIKVFACAAFGRCTEAMKLESIRGCCTGCASYAAATASPVTVHS